MIKLLLILTAYSQAQTSGNSCTPAYVLDANLNCSGITTSQISTISYPVPVSFGLTAKSTFYSMPGGSVYSLSTSSGINITSGPLTLGGGGFIRFSDGSTQLVAAVSGQATSVAQGGVDFSTITTQLNTKLSSGAVSTAFVDLSTVASITFVVTQLNTKLSSGAIPSGFVDFSTVTTQLNSKFSSGSISGSFVDFSTITTQLNTKLSSGAVPTAYIDLSTVVTALAGKLSTTGQAVSVASGGTDFSTITTALNGKLGSTAQAVSVALGGLDLSTVTTQLNSKFSSGAISGSFVDFSTIATQLNTKLSSGTTIPSAFIGLSTCIGQNGIGTLSSMTITGSTFSVGTSQFFVYATSAGVMTSTPSYTLDIAGAIRSTATLITKFGLIAFSSVPVFYTCTDISTQTLSNGATVMAFTVDSPIILKRVTTLVKAVGTGGSGDAISCGTAGPVITASAGAASAKGTITNGVGSIAVPNGNNVQCYYMGTSAPKPTLNLCLSYQMQ